MILPPVKNPGKLSPGRARLERDLTQCVRCAACLPYCPTFQLTLDEGHSPRGRISLVRAMHEGLAEESAGMQSYLGACLECRACETACPNNVEFHKVIDHGRERLAGKVKEGWAARFFKWLFLKKIFSSTRAFDRFMSFLRFYQKSGLQWVMRKTRVLHLLPWNLGKLEKMFPAGLGRHRPARKKEECLLIPRGKIRGSLNLFTGCINDHWLQNSTHSVIKTLLRLGYQVRIPPTQECCGALHAHLGDRQGAMELARKNMTAFSANDDPVLLHAAGCGAMLKDYKHLFEFETEEEQAGGFVKRIIDFNQLVAAHLDELIFDRQFAYRVSYDDPCHLVHAQGISSEPRQILKALPGLKYVELKEADWCCGSAGVYNVVHYKWSMEFLQRKLKHVAAGGAEVLVTSNPGCYLQLKVGAEGLERPVRVLHIAEVVESCFEGEPPLAPESSNPPWV